VDPSFYTSLAHSLSHEQENSYYIYSRKTENITAQCPGKAEENTPIEGSNFVTTNCDISFMDTVYKFVGDASGHVANVAVQSAASLLKEEWDSINSQIFPGGLGAELMLRWLGWIGLEVPMDLAIEILTSSTIVGILLAIIWFSAIAITGIARRCCRKKREVPIYSIATAPQIEHNHERPIPASRVYWPGNWISRV